MKGPARIALIAIPTCTTLAILLFLYQPVQLFHWSDFKTGNELVFRVEEFRVSHGRLPETLSDVGIDDADSRVFYRKVSDDEYRVWFGISVGESETYNSRTKKWD